MNEFKEYISSILAEVAMDSKGKKDMEDEIEDHLKLLKQEFMDRGYSEKDAIEMAVKKFGEVKDIGAKYASSLSPFNKHIRIIAGVLFIMYMLLLIQNAFFTPFSIYTPYTSINLVPFKTILHYLSNFNNINYSSWFNNLFGMVIAFMPFGFLIPIMHIRMNRLYTIVTVSLLLSILIEALQFIAIRGVSDIDDVILNILGSVLGFVASNIFTKVVFLIKGKVSSIKIVKG